MSHADVNALHAGGTGIGAHQPVVDATHVVEMHAGEQTNGLANSKVVHTDGTPGERGGGKGEGSLGIGVTEVDHRGPPYAP